MEMDGCLHLADMFMVLVLVTLAVEKLHQSKVKAS